MWTVCVVDFLGFDFSSKPQLPWQPLSHTRLSYESLQSERIMKGDALQTNTMVFSYFSWSGSSDQGTNCHRIDKTTTVPNDFFNVSRSFFQYSQFEAHQNLDRQLFLVFSSTEKQLPQHGVATVLQTKSTELRMAASKRSILQVANKVRHFISLNRFWPLAIRARLRNTVWRTGSFMHRDTGIYTRPKISLFWKNNEAVHHF